MEFKQLGVRPVLDRIIIKQDQAKDMEGVLFIADNVKEKPRSGVVMAVGTGAIGNDGEYIKMMSKLGDKVVYGEHAGVNVTIEGEEYVILKECDLLYIL